MTTTACEDLYKDLVTAIFTSYEVMGIIPDATPCIEAAAQKKGYYEEADSLGRVFGYYNGVRVPRRGSLEEKAAQSRQSVDRFGQGIRSGFDKKSADRREANDTKKVVSPLSRKESLARNKEAEDTKSVTPPLSREESLARKKSWEPKLKEDYKAGQQVGRAARAILELPSVKKAIENLDLVVESMSLSKEQEAKISQDYTDVSRKLSEPLIAVYNKIDPEAGVHFQRGFAIASESIKANGVKEGFKVIQGHLADAARVSPPMVEKNHRMRGLIAGIGAAAGGVVAIAGLVASSGYAAGQKLGTMAGEQARSVAEKVSQTQTYQKAKAQFDQTKESLQKAGGKAYNAINMLPTTAVDTIKGINEFRQQAMKDFDDKKLESSLNMMAGATGMIGGMVGFLMGMGMPKEERSKYNEAVVAPLLLRLKDSQVNFQKQRVDAYKITDPAKRKAALQAISEDMAKSSQSLFSDLGETTKNFRKKESPSGGEKSEETSQSSSKQSGGMTPSENQG